jgi:NAD(P)-dependent dehydrogenase (short-subunit alcohol dehydrogenase family)
MKQHWNAQDIPDQSGRNALVTGANAGIGFEIASALAAKGATVFLACRSPSKAADAAVRIHAKSPLSKIEIVPLDLGSLDSIKSATDLVASRMQGLDLLINNAGLMATDLSRTADGFEMQIGVNHLGHFALTMHLLPLLSKAQGSRIVTMSSIGHRRGKMDLADLNYEHRRYRRWEAYFQSKLANLLFSAELNRRLVASGGSSRSLAAHPGVAKTDLGSEGSSLTNRLLSPNTPFGSQSAQAGALPALRAATDAEAKGGEFYGPRWFLRGYPSKETPNKAARAEASAEALWRLSESLTNVSYDHR